MSHVTSSVGASEGELHSPNLSIEYRLIYAIVFLSALLVACLCLLLPKRLNPLFDSSESRSPFAQARCSAGSVLPYVFRV